MTDSYYNPPPDEGLEPVYLDDALLIVNKPAGLLTVPGKALHKQDCLLTRLQRQFDDVLIVHRLDMSTSGLIVLARNRRMHRALSLLFQQRQVNKQYIACVSGRMPQHSGLIELPLRVDWPRRPRQKVDLLHGKPSLTGYQRIAYQQQTTRVRLFPVTGRSHQLRVHLAACGFPIIGDNLYHPEYRQRQARLMLHASRLQFVHPDRDELLQFTSTPEF